MTFLILGAAVDNKRHASLGGDVFALRCCQTKTSLHVDNDTRLPVVRGVIPCTRDFLGVASRALTSVKWWWSCTSINMDFVFDFGVGMRHLIVSQ